MWEGSVTWQCKRPTLSCTLHATSAQRHRSINRFLFRVPGAEPPSTPSPHWIPSWIQSAQNLCWHVQRPRIVAGVDGWQLWEIDAGRRGATHMYSVDSGDVPDQSDVENIWRILPYLYIRNIISWRYLYYYICRYPRITSRLSVYINPPDPRSNASAVYSHL